MDIASKNGLATGVVSMADFTDATPATFLSHSDSRNKNQKIAKGVSASNVDVIISGGLNYAFSNTTFEYLLDWNGNPVYSEMENDDVFEMLQDAGYDTYLGKEAKRPFLSDESSEKAFYALTDGNMPFNYVRKSAENKETYRDLPDLNEMAEKAIRSLEKDEDGFMLMLEASAIDDAAHYGRVDYLSAEMGELDRTLAVIFDFYQAHPDDTLIILTADHETGNEILSEEKFAKLEQIAGGVPWDQSIADIDKFILDNFQRQVYSDKVVLSLDCIAQDYYGNDYENRLYGAAAIMDIIYEQCGFNLRSLDHSHQDVPLYVTGFGSEAFEEAQSIMEISDIICDLLEFENTLGEKYSE
jgi:alkaline phosphatase